MPLPTTPATTPREIPAARVRLRVALMVVAIWLVSALPVLLGFASCPVARFLHTPCPGCGMSRAMLLLREGDLAASLAMHPLAVPTAVTQLAFAIVTVVLTLRLGTPLTLWSKRAGRVSAYAALGVLFLDLLLWLARFGGFFHGPVPVQLSL